MSAWFAMGGHGAYIWGAYGATAVMLTGLAVASLRALHRNQAELDALDRKPRGGRKGPR